MITIGVGRKLDLTAIKAVARENSKVRLSEQSIAKMKASHQILINSADTRTPVYGLNTQFGSQVNILDKNLDSDEKEYSESLKNRQLNLVISHNCGLGEEMGEEISRATMLLRSHCLALGHSGVRPIVVDSLLDFINNKIHPVIRKYGSIGASGDLIPLSSIASALIGKGEVLYGNRKIESAIAMKNVGLEKLQLETREGLALINGTSFMTSVAAISLYDLKRIFDQMLSAISMALESLRVIDSAYDPLVHKLKNHSGEIEVNNIIRKLWKGSRLIRNLSDLRIKSLKNFKTNGSNNIDNNLQDYYSLRSVPQGFGVFKENLQTAEKWIEDEINSINDNPVIDPSSMKICHGANFMGYYVTEACDLLKMDVSQASTWLHAILSNLYHPRKNFGLPANLIEHSEIYNGFRPLHILSASLTVQNRKLAQSQQAYMIPTEGDNQDVNSLAAHAAQDLKESVANLERLVSILTISSAQALEFRGLNNCSTHSQNVVKKIRKVSSFVNIDRPLNKDVEKIIEIMRLEEI